MASKSPKDIRALRRSSRLGSSHRNDEGIKSTVQASPRRTTGQLRLPTPVASTTKRRVKRTTTASRRSKSKRPAKGSARNCTESDASLDPSNHDHESLSPTDCAYCSPTTDHTRCLHNRGKPRPPKSPGSYLGPDVVLQSVETARKNVDAPMSGHQIGNEEQWHNVDNIVSILSKTREKDQASRTISKPFVNILPKPASSTDLHSDADTEMLSPSCTYPPSHQLPQQTASHPVLQPSQDPHVRFVNTFPDSYTSESTAKWKKKLALCEPLVIPQFRPPTIVPGSPSSNSPQSPRPMAMPSLYSHSHFSDQSAMSTTPGVFVSSQLQYPTPTGLRTQHTYQLKDLSTSVGANSMYSVPSSANAISWYGSERSVASDVYPTGRQNIAMWSENSGQGKPSSMPEAYLQPPTPILRARELPDYTKFPPPASFM
ncbi:uncharacterized protein SPSK_09244 [Sporothrix schenckii 1099-18]|uniref:Uncharacterized protein n=1 Tax=Sporothrix schenckii 1099-18 TaxID=1397361 RepID=A0A0F2M8Z7_SPOSC|nr:uncharacterized protein SPSK_09244 [Sporothrix schenckii 1099-18]KJR85554.1 hypothetical protein SPSK_09244 [Sporothrix schenckii 1099-18]